MFRILCAAIAAVGATCAVAEDLPDPASFSDVANAPTLEYLGSGRPNLTNRGNRNYIVIVDGDNFNSGRSESNGLYGRSQLDGPLTVLQAYSLSYTRTWIDDTGYSLDAPLSAAPAAPVPEPGEWAMIAAGLGVIGFAARKRRPA